MTEVIVCPYCGSTELVETTNTLSNGGISPINSRFKVAQLYHLVCTDCGAVVKSYVKEPEKLKKKK